MKKLAIGLLIFAILAMGTIFVSAKNFGDETGLEIVFAKQDDENGLRGKFIRRILNRIADRLNLTEQQRAEIRQILEEAKPRVQPLLLEAKATHQQIKELGRDGVYNEAKVQELAARQANTIRQLIVEKEKVKAQIFAVLNEEQRAQAIQMQEKFKQKIHGRMMQNF